jgi:hypothetical protein
MNPFKLYFVVSCLVWLLGSFMEFFGLVLAFAEPGKCFYEGIS